VLYSEENSLFEHIFEHAAYDKLDEERARESPRTVAIARGVAIGGVALLVLCTLEVLTALDLRVAIAWHILIGIVLIPLLVLKLALATWRFASFYRASSPAHVHSAPWLPLRILAPLLVVVTVLVVLSGVELTFAGPASFSDTFLAPAHFLLAGIWLVLLFIHTLAYAKRSVRSTRLDLGGAVALRRGPLLRTGVVVGAIVLGVAASTIALAKADAWQRAMLVGTREAAIAARQPVPGYSPTALANGRRRQATHLRIARYVRSHSG
jgi:hypothetical protein